MPESTVLPITSLIVNFKLQMRADGIDHETRAEYAEILQATGWLFPPVVVFRDGDEIHLADGFHRYAAALDTKQTEIPADVREGTERDALLFSCGANAGHGRRRSNRDKRRAISVMLDDDEWGQASSKWIANQVGCDDHTVAKVRLERKSAARRGEDASSRGGSPTSEFRSENAQLTAASRSENPQNVDATHGEESPSPEDDAPTAPQSSKLRKCKDGRTMDTTNIGRPASDARINPAVICENQKMIIAAALSRIREHQAAMHHTDILPLCTMLLDAARHYAEALPVDERARLAIGGASDEQA